MTKVLSHSGNEVYIGHFQGNAIKHYVELASELSVIPKSVSKDITIITAFTDKERAILALQLEQSLVPYKNTCPSVVESWENTDKIKYFIEALEQTTTPYAILADAYDVVLLKNLDDEFIRKFDSFNKGAVYNATKNNYPNFNIDVVPNREALGEFKYLNAGLVMGRTDYLLSLYRDIWELTQNKNIMNPWKSEQMLVRIASNGREEVTFDHECILFQTFSKTQEIKCGNTSIIT